MGNSFIATSVIWHPLHEKINLSLWFRSLWCYLCNKAVHHPLFHPAAEGDPASEADLVFINLNPAI
jgi:hypothetical protein